MTKTKISKLPPRYSYMLKPYSDVRLSKCPKCQKLTHEYMVFGTIEKKMWQEGLKGQKNSFEEILKHIADFKKVYDLDYQPGGWYPANKLKN